MTNNRIENIKDLVCFLEPNQILELSKDLKIPDGNSIDIEQIQFHILDTCHHNINNLGIQYENHVCSYYSIYEIQFTEEFQDEVCESNKEWMDILLFLFQLYQYDYYLDCLCQNLILEPPMYIDFFRRLDIFVDPYSGEFLDRSFYRANEEKINRLYQKEKRTDKIRSLIGNIKTDA